MAGNKQQRPQGEATAAKAHDEAPGGAQGQTLSDFLDALGDGIYGVDPEGRCTFANRAALQMLGYATPGEVLGRTMHALIHHTRPDGTPYPRADCPLLHTLQERAPRAPGQ